MMSKKYLYTFLIAAIGLVLSNLAYAQVKTVSINCKGEVAIDYLLTDIIDLPFKEGIFKFTDNSLALKRIPIEYATVDSTWYRYEPLSLVSFDMGFEKKVPWNWLVKGKISKPTEDELVYTYRDSRIEGCSRSHWQETDEYAYHLRFAKNRLRSVDFEEKKHRSKKKKITATFLYNRSGLVKKILFSTDMFYRFEYAKNKRLTRIVAQYNDIKNKKGRDSVRTVFARYRVKQTEFEYKEKYFSAYLKNDYTTPTHKVLSKWFDLRNELIPLEKNIDAAYETDNYPEKKLSRLEDRFDTLEEVHDSLTELFEEQTMLFAYQFERGNITSVYYMDFEEDYADVYHLQDSFVYSPSNQLLRHISYEEKNEYTVNDYRYNDQGKIIGKTQSRLSDSVEHKLHWIEYSYSDDGRISAMKTFDKEWSDDFRKGSSRIYYK